MSQDLASQIAKALAEYSTEVEEEVDKIAEETAEEAVQKLKTTSPKSPRAKGGKYAKSWKKTKMGKGNFVVHNTNYRLPHLLEFGHLKRNGGRVSGIVHIKPAEDHAIENFEKKLKELGR